MSERLEEEELRTWRAFLGAHARIVKVLDQELSEEEGLNLHQYEVLLRLAQAPDRSLRMSELAAKVLLSPSGVTRAVDQMERRGLVERVVCPTDRRGYLATLTAKGRARLKRASKVHVRGVRAHFTERLSRSQMAALGSVMERVAGSADTEL